MTSPRFLAVGLCALVLGTAVGAVPAGADTFVQQAWWWRVQSGLLVQVPPPPEVPENGFSVAGAPDGPSSVAALRYDVAEDATAAALTLEVASDQGGDQAVLLACRAGAPWVPARAGRWEDRPPADCEAGAVTGVRGEGTWTFEVAALLGDGRLDVVFLPGTVEDAPPGADGSVFSLAFEGAPVLRTQAGGTTTSAPATPIAPPPATRPADRPGTAAPPASQGGSTGFGTFAPPADGLAAAAEASQPDAAEPEPLNGRAAPWPVAVRDPAPVASERSSASRDGRMLGALLALMCVGAAGIFARQRETAPDGDRVGGLGRFAKPRQGPPPRL